MLHTGLLRNAPQLYKLPQNKSWPSLAGALFSQKESAVVLFVLFGNPSYSEKLKSVPKRYEVSNFQANKRNVIISGQIPTTSNQNNSPAAFFLPSSGYHTPPNDIKHILPGDPP
jgi:hypothetical protein